MRGEAEIIVGAEVDDFLAVEIGDGLLLAFENFQTEVEMLGLQVFERVVQVLELRARAAVLMSLLVCGRMNRLRRRDYASSLPLG